MHCLSVVMCVDFSDPISVREDDIFQHFQKNTGDKHIYVALVDIPNKVNRVKIRTMYFSVCLHMCMCLCSSENLM